VKNTLRISEILVGTRVRKEMGDLKGLADSIRDRGLLQPVVVDQGNNLIAGFRRIEAAKWFLGWKEIPVRVVDTDDLLSAERDENTVRKDFTPTEAVAIGRLIEEEHRQRIADTRSDMARKAGAVSVNARFGKNLTVVQTEALGRTAEVAAKAVGVSHPTYTQAKAVVEAAESDPDKYADIAEQMDATGNVKGAHDEMKRRAAGAPKSKVQPKGKKPAGRIVRGDAGKAAPVYEQGLADAMAWLRKYGHVRMFAPIRDAILEVNKSMNEGSAA
jgi:ParB-like chromosome segregation protein Spo0J